MMRWVPVLGLLSVGEGEPEEVWTATALDGIEPASHPILDDFTKCLELCRRMNELGWTEDDYLDNSSQVHEAIESGEIGLLETPQPRRRLFQIVKNWLTGKEEA